MHWTLPLNPICQNLRHWRRGNLSWLDCDRLMAVLTLKMQFVHLLTNWVVSFFSMCSPVWVSFSVDECLIYYNLSLQWYIDKNLHLKIFLLHPIFNRSTQRTPSVRVSCTKSHHSTRCETLLFFTKLNWIITLGKPPFLFLVSSTVYFSQSILFARQPDSGCSAG